MIARLRGQIAEIEADRVTLDVHGVGYDVAVPSRLAETLRVDQEVVLHVYTAVREDAIALYGFASPAEKGVFDLLIGVTGIGPRLALSTLSALPVPELARAIEGNDLRVLSKVPGVGRKTAERMVLELRGKLAWAPTTTAKSASPADPFPLALAQLGYKKSEIDAALVRLSDMADAPLNERVAAALRMFVGG